MIRTGKEYHDSIHDRRAVDINCGKTRDVATRPQRAKIIETHNRNVSDTGSFKVLATTEKVA